MQRAAPHAKKIVIKEGRSGRKREEDIIAQDKVRAKACSENARTEVILERGKNGALGRNRKRETEKQK